MVEPRYRWQFPRGLPLDDAFHDAARRAGVRPRLAELLWGRGMTAAEVPGFMAPAAAAGLHDPGLLPDADAVLARIGRARARGERVLVFGDFDADGLTGAAILVRALRRLDLDVVPYVPDRVREGHGLSTLAIERAVAERAALIVTVDCGTSSRSEVEAAAGQGIDVLITDHHRIPPALPPAVAIVNPQRADSRYPHRTLSGAGVAFKLAQLLLDDQPGGAEAALALADLAAIGTVADLAPVLGENRSIARLGLEHLRAGTNAGLAALLRTAAVDPSRADLETVAFVVAPRLNAAGRIGDATIALELLLTDDPERGAALAEELGRANSTRRDLTRDAVEAAEAVVDAAAAAALAADPDQGVQSVQGGAVVVRGPWPVGIVGLVASRLSERRSRPAVVGAELDGVIRASCRTARGSGFDLGAALEECHDLLTRYGGHAGAAGFELPQANWDAFVTRFQALAAGVPAPDPRPALAVDLSVPALELDYALLRDLALLAPTGPGNPEPVLAVQDLTVTRVRAATGGHTQLTLRRRIDVIDAIAFDRPDLADALQEGDRLDVAARVASRAFGGYESLQLEVRDVAPAGLLRPLPVPVPELAAAPAASGPVVVGALA